MMAEKRLSNGHRVGIPRGLASCRGRHPACETPAIVAVLLALGGLSACWMGCASEEPVEADAATARDVLDGEPASDAAEIRPSDPLTEVDHEGPGNPPAAVIDSVSVDPREVVAGSIVTVTVTVRVDGTVPLRDGVVTVKLASPAGGERSAAIEEVSALPGVSVSIDHQSEPLDGEGVWRFSASLATSDGHMLDSGPAGGVPVTVGPAEPDIATVVDQVAHAAEGKGYCGCSTRGCIEEGCGDCWAMSYFIFDLLCAGGVSARIVQYPTEYSWNHRSVLYFDGSSWVDFPYYSYDIAWQFRNTSSSLTGTVIESCG